MESFASLTRKEGGTLDEFADREVGCLIDYLAEYLGNEKEDFRHLYVGERVKITYVAGDSVEARNRRVATLLDSDRRALLASLRDYLPEDALKSMDSFFDVSIGLFDRASFRELRVLLIGDCLYLDVMAFLTGLAANDGITLLPHYITFRDMLKVRDEVRALKGMRFDVVFFSPFTYDMHPAFGQCFASSSAFEMATTTFDRLAPLMSEVEQVMDAVASTFECPLFVHNTIALVRGHPVKRAMKSLLTFMTRRRVRRFIDTWLRTYISRRRVDQVTEMYCFDESSLLVDSSAYELGAFYYDHVLQHPAAMGRAVAHRYADICSVIAHLLKKKLIVCDLDNTLWEGVIGEGPVTHFVDRQEILLRLAGNGVVLAICSKNDPARVHWNGGVMSEKDFVQSEISWEPKVHAFPRMENRLNLKMKDFVFLDDRRDEREMVSSVYPQIVTIDPAESGTWHRLSLWGDLLGTGSVMNRTRMYQERAEREAFVDEVAGVTEPADRAALYRELELRLVITRPEARALKRISELINRTNQFNMQGSRTSTRELMAWHADGAYHILQGSMSDRFGDMGVVCVLIAVEGEQYIDVSIFVLSCRVFGYGVETAMLNHLKRLAGVAGKRIVGRHLATPHNAPCQNVYRDNGFEISDGAWVYSGFEAVEDPAWLTVSAP